MVDGHEKITADAAAPTLGPCIVVDLDGTLLRGNSLHLFIKFLLVRLLSRLRLLAVAKILGLLAARKLHLISHVAMKHPLHQLGATVMTDGEMQDFARSLLPKLDKKLYSKLVDMKTARGAQLILSTAAPDLYVSHLVAHLGEIDSWLATQLSASPADYIENRSDVKLTRTLDYATYNHLKIIAVVTDHDDDLPLLTLPDIRRLLVTPPATLLSTLTRNHLAHEIYIPD